MTTPETLAEEIAAKHFTMPNLITGENFVPPKYIEAVLFGVKAGAESRQIDYQSWQNCQQKLKDANERIVEFESIKAGHLEVQKELSDQIHATEEKLKLAVETINQMQGYIRSYTNPNSFMGRDLQEAFNLGAKFNYDNPELFNSYLAKIKESE